jgi:YbbR domain-containing protein
MRDILSAAMTRANLLRLIASLVLAFILWGWVSTIEDPKRERTFSDLTIVSEGLSESLVVTTSIPAATVQLDGPQSAVSGLTPGTVIPYVDLSDISEPGTYTVPVDVEHIDDLWHTDVSPNALRITVESRVSKTVPLQSEIVGEVGSNRQVNDIREAVTQVTVEGSESAVNRVASVVLPITIGTQTRVYVDNFVPEARDANGDVVEDVVITPGTISATIDISQRGKEVAVVPQYTGIPAAGYRVSGQVSSPLTVIVDGPSDALADVVAVQTDPVDVQGATATVRETVPIVDLPPGVEVISPTDGQVVVQISIVQDGVRQELPGQDVIAVNTEGVAVQIEPGQISVTVYGPAQELAQLRAGDIIVQVDVRGLGPGTYQLSPTVYLPQGLTWVSSTPSVVTVTVSSVTAGNEPSGSPQGAPDAVGTPVATLGP